MNPIGLVKHFHRISRTIGFDLFGCLNLKLLIFEVRSSTEFSEKTKFENLTVLDKVEIPDRWAPPVSDSLRAGI